MLRPLKQMIFISFLVSKLLFSKDVPSKNDKWSLHEFVKHSHALKEQAIAHKSNTKRKEQGENSSFKSYDTTLQPLKENYNELLNKTFTLEGTEHNSRDFYIFISFSLPRKTLLSLLKDARKYGATLVLRGLKDGSFKKTMAELMELYKHEKGQVILDPTLFKRFNVTSVPTFLLAPRAFVLGGSEPLEHKQRGSEKNNQEFLVLRGNVSPRFALTEFRKHTPFEEFAKELLQ